LGSKVGPGGAFGARYGTVARKRYVEIVSKMRRRHECPRCKIRSVRRLSVGVWLCRKCGYKFAGGAYSPQTKLGETSRRFGGLVKPTMVEAEGKAEAEEKTGAKKRRREKIKEAEKPAARRIRKEKAQRGEKAETKQVRKTRKGASKEESK